MILWWRRWCCIVSSVFGVVVICFGWCGEGIGEASARGCKALRRMKRAWTGGGDLSATC